jgi:hypothetical protein
LVAQLAPSFVQQPQLFAQQMLVAPDWLKTQEPEPHSSPTEHSVPFGLRNRHIVPFELQ